MPKSTSGGASNAWEEAQAVPVESAPAGDAPVEPEPEPVEVPQEPEQPTTEPEQTTVTGEHGPELPLATGGVISASDHPIIVGESGPEMVVPPGWTQPSTDTPAEPDGEA